MNKRIGLVVAMTVVAIAGAAGPASARWWGDGRWHDDNDRWRHHHHYYGYHYQPPPVVYGTPYRYGYAPPPVVYGAEPGVNLNIHIR
jgi:hypothetical protein